MYRLYRCCVGIVELRLLLEYNSNNNYNNNMFLETERVASAEVRKSEGHDKPKVLIAPLFSAFRSRSVINLWTFDLNILLRGF